MCEADRAVLEARVAASTTPRRDWQRAKVVLMAAEGLSSPVIGKAVGLNRNQVDVWRRRYGEVGLGGLADRPLSGRPRVYGPAERLALVKTITTRPPEAGQLGGRRLKARMSMPEVAGSCARTSHRDLGLAGVADLHLDGPQAVAGALVG